MKTWVISDTHLNHNKIKTYCQRPDNHTELTDKNIHRLVGPRDILIHMGDVGMDKPEVWMETVRNWPGFKWLVRGNHDDKGAQWYVDKGLFHMACDAMIYRGVWLTHRPWREALPAGTHMNIHGHLHNVWHGFGKDDPEAKKGEFWLPFERGTLEFPWQRLLALEYTNYGPVEFDKFVAKGHRLYQSTGPNEETKKYLRLIKEDGAKCSTCIPGGSNGEV
jgi:calcineurin-like phosphoesterase family protein